MRILFLNASIILNFRCFFYARIRMLSQVLIVALNEIKIPTLNRISFRLTDLTHFEVTLIWSVGQTLDF